MEQMNWIVSPGHEALIHVHRPPGKGPILYSLGDGYWIPQSFTARLIPDDADSMWKKLVVSMVIEYDAATAPPERLIAVEVHRGMGEARGWIGDDFFTGKPEAEPPESPAIDLKDLQLPLDQLESLVQLAVEANVLAGPARPVGERLPDDDRRYISRKDGSALGLVARRRRIVDENHLALVAKDYVTAIEEGNGTTAAIAEKYFLSAVAARKRIIQARKAGMLTETQERKKGGELTDRANQVLIRLQEGKHSKKENEPPEDES